MKDTEKKVEYIELIYDLIFVYLVSRNGSLLNTVEHGFIRPNAYFTYLASTLIILQLWYFSTLFINRYGCGRLQESLGMFLNMYLLYFMADGIQEDWGTTYFRYNLAWALILLNLAFQYFLHLWKERPDSEYERKQIRSQIKLLCSEAFLVILFIPVYQITGIALAPWAMIFGIVCSVLTQPINVRVPVDFPHLSERVMLYVVFSFGEMILGIAGYFHGDLQVDTVYYSLMAFLIVAGLFISYGYFYDHLLDRELTTSGTVYLLLHMVWITILGQITCALEFMPEGKIQAVPKNVFLVLSILVFFICLLFTERFSSKEIPNRKRFYLILGGEFLLYAVLMALTYQNGKISIAVTVVFIYFQGFSMRKGTEKNKRKDTQ